MIDSDGFVAKYKNNRILNSARSSVTAMIYTVTVSFVPFIIRTLMIRELGDDCVGINTVLMSIIYMLNTAEMGIGSVVTYFLYEPLALGDNERVDLYVGIFRRLYRYIGTFITIVGILVLPFLKMIIGGAGFYKYNIYVIYLIYLSSTVFTYFILPEVMILLQASQRSDVVYGINLIGNCIAYTLQIVSIVFFHSFYFYFYSLIIQALVVALLRYLTKVRYWNRQTSSNQQGKKEIKNIFSRVYCLVGHQLDESVMSVVDNVLLSASCGLITVTLYGNYMLILSALGMILSSFFSTLTASIGNAIITETKESNFTRFKAVLWLNGMIVSWMTVCIICTTQTFMTIWMGDRLLDERVLVLFGIYFFTIQMRRTVQLFKNALGMWYEDRYKPYLGMAVNLIIDVVLIRKYGIEAAVISTIVSVVCIEIPWEVNVLLKHFFNKRIAEYYVKLLGYIVLSVAASLTSRWICTLYHGRSTLCWFVIEAVLSTLIWGVMAFVLYCKAEEFKIWRETMGLLKNTIRE